LYLDAKRDTDWFNYLHSGCAAAMISVSSAMDRPRAFLKCWLPVLLWMALIFFASSDSHSYEHSSRIIVPFLHWLFPNMLQANVETIHHVFRKCCHLTEYAVLALLLWRALHQSNTNLPTWSWPKVGGVLLLVFLYAASDEFHQSFVPTRTPLVSDVFIDTAGGTIGLLAFWFVHHFGNRRHRTEP
jgi:VanZ family protein